MGLALTTEKASPIPPASSVAGAGAFTSLPATAGAISVFGMATAAIHPISRARAAASRLPTIEGSEADLTSIATPQAIWVGALGIGGGGLLRILDLGDHHTM